MDDLTRKQRTRILVATVGAVCLLTAFAIAAAPVEAGYCSIGHLIKWPTGAAPDYNNNGKVCYDQRSQITVDDSFGPS